MTRRKFDAKTLVIASHNPGKVQEISALLAPYDVAVSSLADHGLPVPMEDGDSFTANARIKSLAAAIATGLPALSDDSGLCVAALNGAPGIHTADWAEKPEGGRDFPMAMAKVEKALDGAVDRSAYFACALSLAWPDGHTEDFMGRVDGTLVWPMRGDKGFGFDPVFQAKGYDITFAEMDPTHKHEISHRADAFRQLVKECFG